MWIVKGLRFTAFWVPPGRLPVSPLDEWGQLTGSEAQSTQIQGSGPGRKVVQDGPYQGLLLRAEIQQHRFDWIVVGNPPTSGMGTPRIPGKFAKVLGQFQTLVERWMQSDSMTSLGVNRVAVVPQVARVFDEPKPALECLDRLIPEVQIDTTTSDFQYTINKQIRSKSGGGEYTINRLNQWVYSQETSGAFLMPPQSVNTLAVEGLRHEFLASLMLDVNNAPVERPIPPGRLKKLTGEIFEVAKSMVLARVEHNAND